MPQVHHAKFFDLWMVRSLKYEKKEKKSYDSFSLICVHLNFNNNDSIAVILTS
jgi:hypothetical protein